MTFTVEDGTVITGANSYVEVAYADTYHSDRGATSWAALTTQQKQTALIKATDYLEQQYAGMWIGYAVEKLQPLSWPRTYADPDYYGVNDISGEVPALVKQATCILALESLTAELNPVQGRATKREKVDVIEVEYSDYAKLGSTRPAIDGLLRKLLNGTSLNAKAVRV